jgi:hypothetical protein
MTFCFESALRFRAPRARPRRLRGACAVALAAAALATWGAPRAARAQSADAVTAEELFVKARADLKRGDYASACPRFEESQRLDPSVGTLLNLADCQEHAGRLARARALLLEAAALARSKRDFEREQVANQRVAVLDKRVPRVRVDVAYTPPGLVVQRDGVELKSASWGIALPVDPGPHVIVATAPGRQRFEMTINAAADGAESAVIIALVDDPDSATNAHPAPVPADTAPAPAPKGWGTQRILAAAVGGAGVIAVGVGSAFGAMALSKNSESKSGCQGDFCSSASAAVRRTARTDGDVSTAFFVAGAVLVGAGVTLYFTAPSDKGGEKRRASAGGWFVSGAVGDRAGGVTCGGAF